MSQRSLFNMEKNSDTVVKLKIADILIQMQSEFGLKPPKKNNQGELFTEFYDDFLYLGEDKADIIIEVNIVDSLPEISAAEDIFVSFHPDAHIEQWRMQKKDNSYIYRCALEDRNQIMLVNETFDRVTAYLLTDKDKGRVWNIAHIVFDFLQVLLINYLALRKNGVFVHSIGVRDLNGRGLLFAGKSGAGKSTTARLWHKYSKATVLNDDRIIVRRLNDNFFIHSSPWHGEFKDYHITYLESAPSDKLFFIYHAPKNTIQRISEKEAFNLLYPTLFPTFWDKRCLENVVSFCQDLTRSVPCFSLGFINNEEVVEFVRKL